MQMLESLEHRELLSSAVMGDATGRGMPEFVDLSYQAMPRRTGLSADGRLAYEAGTRYVTADGAPTGGTHVTSPGVSVFGVNHDGVADLIITRSDGSFRCTGSLLWTGRHVLTAAHCLTDDNGVMNTSSVSITWKLTSGDINSSAGASAISIHPNWTGDFLGMGYDLAIITLPAVVSSSVPRYEIYRGGGEVGLTSVKVGFGASGYGGTGALLSSGTKRAGLNAWDNNANVLSGVGATNGSAQLVYDFDNAQSAQDAFGYFFSQPNLGLGNDEVNSAPGDSGGPTFILDAGTYKIAGVTSYGLRLHRNSGPQPRSSDIDGILNSSFGEFSIDTRVSSFTAFIDGLVVSDPIDLQLNFDFGTSSSPVEVGYTRVTTTAYDAVVGYGWLPGAADLGVLSRTSGTALTRDLAYTKDGTFVVDLPDGEYDVTLHIGDTLNAHEQMGIYFEGALADALSTAGGEVIARTYRVTVTDGQLSLRLDDLGGPNAYVTIVGLQIDEASGDPPPPFAARYDFGTVSSPVEAGFTRATQAAYSAGAGFGWLAGAVDLGVLSRSSGTSLTRDLAYTKDASFAVDVPEGEYDVTLYIGDTLNAHEQMGIYLEGALVDTLDTASGQVLARTYRLLVSDGQLSLRLDDLGGPNAYVTIVGMEIEVAQGDPPPTYVARYDFATASSPIEAGYTRATTAAYSASTGFGWLAGADGLGVLERSSGTSLTRDLAYVRDGTFVVDLADGTYDVTLYIGDTLNAHEQMGLYLEGSLVDTVSTAGGEVLALTYQVVVIDGQLTLRLDDLGGANAYVTIVGMDIATVTP